MKAASNSTAVVAAASNSTTTTGKKGKVSYEHGVDAPFKSEFDLGRWCRCRCSFKFDFNRRYRKVRQGK
jgi:hypothetical protein